MAPTNAPALDPDAIAAALRRPLPGFAAQGRMAVRPRPGGFTPPEDITPRESAVLILLYPRDGALHVALILRSEDGGSHSGQVSFPGGGQHPGEPFEETALRESGEEVGLDPGAVRLLGTLTPLYVPASGNRMHPFVGYTPSPPRWAIDPVEVQAVFDAPLAFFVDEGNVREETWQFGEYPVRVPQFNVKGHVVWGATAMLLAELAAALKGT